ncbi:MAG: hypothetical protein WAU88_06025 [Candidatus Zixiibacteriota bacterium]
MVPIVVGVVLAGAVALLATMCGWDRDRSFYPVVTIVVGSYYVLFAIMGGSSGTILTESLVGLAFLAAAVTGFRTSLWIVAIALAGHGVFDLVHGMFISNPGMPTWWPQWCATFDVALGAYFAWQLKSGKIRG